MVTIGVFITNLVARNEKMKQSALKSLKEQFPSLLSVSVPEDVNEVVIALPSIEFRVQLLSGGVRPKECVESDKLTFVCGQVSDSVLKRVSVLAKHAEKCSSGDIKAELLQSKWIKYLSDVSFND